jgi:hypothetical protein
MEIEWSMRCVQCINQFDDRELLEQVSILKVIFQKIFEFEYSAAWRGRL